MADHYADGTCQWWHLSQPPPELVAALGDGWLPGGGRVLDIGCGLGTEAGYLASAGLAGGGHRVDETVIGRAFGGWRVEHMERAAVPSDTRMLEVIVARLSV